jgi:hypothetical protein
MFFCLFGLSPKLLLQFHFATIQIPKVNHQVAKKNSQKTLNLGGLAFLAVKKKENVG